MTTAEHHPRSRPSLDAPRPRARAPRHRRHLAQPRRRLRHSRPRRPGRRRGLARVRSSRSRRNRRPPEATRMPAIAFTAARPTSHSSPATSPAARRPAPTRSSKPASPASSPPPSIPTPPSPATASKRCAPRAFKSVVGLCQAEARRLNEGFARWIQHHRPFVLMKVAMTLDARIAPPPAQQTPHAPYWITSEVARAAVQPLRWAADATMVGVDTVLADDPWMTDRSGLRRRRPLLRIVLDSALRMPLDCKLVSTAQNDVVIFTVSHDEARIRELASRGVRVEVLPCGCRPRPARQSARQARRRRRPHPAH